MKKTYEIIEDYIKSSEEFYKNLNINLLDLNFEKDFSKIKLETILGEKHCGYNNVIHGGVISALLDSITGIIYQRKIKKLHLRRI